MTLSADSQAVLLLCSSIGLSSRSDTAPLSLKDWNPLAKKLQSLSLRPAALLGKTQPELKDLLALNETEIKRLFYLLARGGALAIELERLASLGIKVLTRADADYPARYRQRLKDSAPAVLFFAGDKALLGQTGLAVVGSRDPDQASQAGAQWIGQTCGASGLVLFSGGARGVDALSMKAALSARGKAVGVLADSLEKAIREPENRAAIIQGKLCLLTPYAPNSSFSTTSAMSRNRLIYTLADYAVVVASQAEKGGTWTGAAEALHANWLPVFVLDHPAMPEGNKKLLQKGALSFPYPFTEHQLPFKEWLDLQSAQAKSDPHQPGLF
jgi:predicted Rossmann fold nucleotide-binding protein DprA/Smf involved in DNA uptake